MLNKPIFNILIFTFLIAAAFSQERKVVEIPLGGSANDRSLEMSSLTWFKDELVLMPQYIDYDDPAFYVIKKAKINNWLKSESSDPIVPQKIKLELTDFRKTIQGYQGFEAICFSGKNIYLIIESKDDESMKSFIIKGVINRKSGIISIQEESLKEIPLPINIKNMGFESIFEYKNQIVTLFEANGSNIYVEPKAIAFNKELSEYNFIEFENLEYRLTDVSRVDNRGRFWAINFFWPGEEKRLKPGYDEVLEKTKKGKTHSTYKHVERLIEFQIKNNSITRTTADPIQLELNHESRNWEGLVRLDRTGFLMIVDEYPRTILAFVKK